jgi:hypothetical protein
MKPDPKPDRTLGRMAPRITWDDTSARINAEARARKRVTSRDDLSTPGLVLAPHDETLAEIADRLKSKMVIK